jgi:protease IV
MEDLNPPNPAKPSAGWEREVLEKIALAALHEQRAARRWKVFFRLLWAGLLAMLVWWLYRDALAPSGPSQPHTALIEVRGTIAADTEASAQTIVAALRAAFEDPGAQGVVLLINSPGGSPVQAGIIADEIHRLKALHQKPIHAVVEETCASAAYYIASAADNIYVDKASIVGSIGVMMNGFGFTELMDKVGVERRLMTAGEHKGFLDPFSPQTQAQQRHAQEMLNDIHQQFIEVVRRGRGERLPPSDELFTGLIWSGQRAVALGLADELASLEHVAREVIQAEDIIDYTQRENMAERLARRFGAGVGESALWSLRDWATAVR